MDARERQFCSIMTEYRDSREFRRLMDLSFHFLDCRRNCVCICGDAGMHVYDCGGFTNICECAANFITVQMRHVQATLLIMNQQNCQFFKKRKNERKFKDRFSSIKLWFNVPPFQTCSSFHTDSSSLVPHYLGL